MCTHRIDGNKSVKEIPSKRLHKTYTINQKLHLYFLHSSVYPLVSARFSMSIFLWLLYYKHTLQHLCGQIIVIYHYFQFNAIRLFTLFLYQEQQQQHQLNFVESSSISQHWIVLRVWYCSARLHVPVGVEFARKKRVEDELI